MKSYTSGGGDVTTCNVLNCSVLAVAESDSPNIHVYDGKGSAEPLKTLKLHMQPVEALAYCPQVLQSLLYCSISDVMN